MQITTEDIGTNKIIKVPVLNEKKTRYQVVLDIVDELKIPTIEAVAAIRAMITAGEVLESEGEGVISLLDAKSVKPDAYQQRKQKLQEIYTNTKPFTNVEGEILTVLAQENKELFGNGNDGGKNGKKNGNGTKGNGNDVIANDQQQELRGRRKKSKLKQTKNKE